MDSAIAGKAQQLLDAYARDADRSVYAVVDAAIGSWAGGAAADEPMPAASLLKLPLALAIEPRLPALASRSVRDLVTDDDVSVLHSLQGDRLVSPTELLSLMLSTSDNPAARWALAEVGFDVLAETIATCGVRDTVVYGDPHDRGMLAGQTTARDAVTLLRVTADPERFPVSARALGHSIRNSRIPLGATADDVRIAHKTGTLTGVAHDVAHIRSDRGQLWIAFLSRHQHDTLVTGYEMGICTREVLEAFGLAAHRTTSAGD